MIHVKTTLRVPGVAVVIHLAELEPLEGSPLCRPVRLLEATAEGSITGAFRRASAQHPAACVNMSSPPQQLIPHPDSWGQLEDIETEMISAEEFAALWLEAEAKLPLH
ncbi:hypothetical protein WG915_07690 [Corynebacterium sp. H128]|uniref:hypothetical protein n=1 Tax=unclassified Corynebacterium TaxID=2624378 RepID=UPI00309FB5AD